MEIKTKRVRALSAKFAPYQQDSIRPLSGMPNLASKRIEMAEMAFHGQSLYPSRAISARPAKQTISFPLGTASIEKERPARKSLSKKVFYNQSKTEQIINLKQTVNKLVEELSQERGKVQIMRRKNNKYSKQLTIQFEDEKKWGAQTVSSHLVTGIKSMYDQLKQKFQRKSKQYDQLLIDSKSTHALQMQAYIEALELANGKLLAEIQAAAEKRLEFPTSNESQQQATSYMVLELQKKVDRLSSKLKDTQKMHKESMQTNKNLELKVQFLEKLMIEKDNNIHAANFKLKKSQKQNTILKNELNQSKLKDNENKKRYQEKLSHYLKIQRELTTNHQLQIEDLTKKKDKIIQTLQKNSNHLQQMHAQMRKTIVDLNNQVQTLKEESLRQRKQQRISYDFSYHPVKQDQTVINRNPIQHKPPQNGKRLPKQANKKHHQNASKKRKIQISQVKDIGELIKYKMIAQSIPKAALKQYFNFNPSSDSADYQWQQQYITMKEVVHILQKQPFELMPESAFCLARYFIEDVSDEFVYCDMLNQNLREVVKSIIANLIQDYQAPDAKIVQEQSKKLALYFGQNLFNALTALEPSGLISKHKFINIVKSISKGECEFNLQYVIATLALKSQHIDRLPYNILYP